jgi:beta-lactamase regulating signal transducer with metallopeptidase domain
MNNFLFELATRSFILAGLGLAIRFALTKSSAHARANVLAITMVALTFLPLVLVILPRLAITVAQREVIEPLVASSGVQIPVTPTSEFPWLLIWAGLALTLLARVVFSLAQFNTVKRSFLPASDLLAGKVLGLAKRAKEVFFCPIGQPPMTWGILQPKIALPIESETWIEPQLRLVVLHEDAHIRRRDWATMIVFRVVSAVYWFNPLVWVMKSLFDQDSERAADDFVLAQGVDAPEYAGRLIEVAKSLKGHQYSIPVVTMARSSRLKGRVKAILCDRTNRRSLKGLAQVAVLGALVIGAVATGIVAPEIRQIRVATRRLAIEAPVQPAQPAKTADIRLNNGMNVHIDDNDLPDTLEEPSMSAKSVKVKDESGASDGPKTQTSLRASSNRSTPQERSHSQEKENISISGMDELKDVNIDLSSIQRDVSEGLAEANKDIESAKKESEKSIKDAEIEIDKTEMPESARAAAKASLKFARGFTDGLLKGFSKKTTHLKEKLAKPQKHNSD